MILSILIPALNEEETIGKVIDSLPKKLNSINKINIIVVNDGSTDKTAKIAEEKGAIVIDHKKNRGVGKSFQDGLEKAIVLKSDIMVSIDADGQFDAKEIPKLIQPLIDNEADLVSGSRFIDPKYIPEKMPRIKVWGNRRVAKLISWATGQKFHDVSCGFRAYSKEAMLWMNLFGKFTYTQETFLDLTYKGLIIKEVPVTVQYFEGRKSRVASNVGAYAFKAFNIIFRTVKDYHPLKFFGLSGSFLFIVGLGLDIFVFTHFINNGTFFPYKMFGFLGAFLNAIGIMIIFIGILADLIDRVRVTEEKILYYQKKRYYESGK
jgi:glycosyltransferase involved in cell wall biosynthesis